MENIQDNNRPFAVITGASTGIGYELAKQFVNNGFDLLIVADEERIQSVASEIQRGVLASSRFRRILRRLRALRLSSKRSSLLDGQ